MSLPALTTMMKEYLSRIFQKTSPDPITPEDAARAEQRLQRTTNFDIDEFFAERPVDVLFNAPLGSTEQCLNVEQVADAAAGTLASEEAKTHLKDCEECLDQIHSYRELEAADFTDATRGIDIASFIRVPAGQKLYLVVYNRGETPVLDQMELKSIEVEGAISGTVKSIDKVDPRQYRAKEAVAVHFEDFTLNVSDSGEAIGNLYFGAKTKAGRFSRRRQVHVIDEAKVRGGGIANSA